jgi:hypothetical protein
VADNHQHTIKLGQVSFQRRQCIEVHVVGRSVRVGEGIGVSESCAGTGG